MNEKFRPVTAIATGDPAGIGPEIVVGTMLDEEIHECCRPFVIGSIAILDRAARILGKELRYNRIEDPSEALLQYETVGVLRTGNYDTDSVRWEEIQELTGRMSVDWIMKSIELDMDHRVDTVSTAPIHKRAIRLTGVKQPGHTKIYQDETHSPYAFTMFSCHRLRVFFVGHRMSLMGAHRYATKERVLEFVENIDKEPRETGIMEPLIAIAALDPHGGGNSLFGMEEIEQLVPAVEAARVEGINAVGPMPADSVFHIGESGEYDAILFSYHDQGRIACKALDFEKSIAPTFGFPFIRNSMGHGIAFDIADKEIAGSISLVESTKVVAEYAALIRKKTDQQPGKQKRGNILCR